MNYSRLLFVFGLVMFAAITRLIPHPPNFTAINAVAVFCAFTLGHFGLSCCVVFGAMVLTDFIFGLHSQLLTVYLSLALIMLSNRFRISPVLALPVSSLLFFFVTNFGVWFVDGIYPRTLGGLGVCYLTALPFLANELMSTCLYGFILFNGFAFFERTIPAIQKSHLQGN